jgi:hypothetical protein
MTSKQRSNLLIGSISAVIAIVSALPVLEIVPSTPPFGYVTMFALPGILLSAVASGNIHAFSSFLVVLFSWIFYALVLVVLRSVIGVFRKND